MLMLVLRGGPGAGTDDGDAVVWIADGELARCDEDGIVETNAVEAWRPTALASAFLAH